MRSVVFELPRSTGICDGVGHTVDATYNGVEIFRYSSTWTIMGTQRRTSSKSRGESLPERWYRGRDVPKAVIRRFAREVAERFQPEKIILFGSHAYGRPHADSDVDILVIMPCRNQLDQAYKILWPSKLPFRWISLSASQRTCNGESERAIHSTRK
jgi:hypothetical protein